MLYVIINTQEVIPLQNRIKEIRRTFKLTQSEFGERIGVKGNTITGYETGVRTPSDAAIKSICREFNCSEDWLRTGTGDMFGTDERDSVTQAFGELASRKDPVIDGFIQFLRSRTPDELAFLHKQLRECVDQMDEATKR